MEFNYQHNFSWPRRARISLLNKLFIRWYNSIEKTPLYYSTFALTMIPIFIGLILLAFFAEASFFLLVLVATFPFMIALLAIIGYSHPQNHLNPIGGILLFIVATIFCLFGFVMAMLGLKWFLSGAIPYPDAPQTWRSFFSVHTNSINWDLLPYAPIEYLSRWKIGFAGMVLTDIFFMEMGPAFMTVLTIFQYQLSEVRGLKLKRSP